MSILLEFTGIAIASTLILAVGADVLATTIEAFYD